MFGSRFGTVLSLVMTLRTASGARLVPDSSDGSLGSRQHELKPAAADLAFELLVAAPSGVVAEVEDTPADVSVSSSEETGAALGYEDTSDDEPQGDSFSGSRIQVCNGIEVRLRSCLRVHRGSSFELRRVIRSLDASDSLCPRMESTSDNEVENHVCTVRLERSLGQLRLSQWLPRSLLSRASWVNSPLVIRYWGESRFDGLRTVDPDGPCAAPRGANVRIRLSDSDRRDTTHPTYLHRQRLQDLGITACWDSQVLRADCRATAPPRHNKDALELVDFERDFGSVRGRRDSR